MGAAGRRDAALLALVTVCLLAPFGAKAFHIDDPLFIRAARHIRSSPADFYGFSVNWYGTEQPMAQVTANPPGASYFIALASLVVGWSEVGLHAAFLLAAVAVALGTWRLARPLTTRPGLAALVAVLSPAFLVSATSVMADTLLVALWVWAVTLWREGIEAPGRARLMAAAALMGAAALTKYVGLCLVPLLLVDSLVGPARRSRRLLALLLPVAVMAAYEWTTLALYGRGLLATASAYAADFRGDEALGLPARLVVSLSFTGGGLAVVGFYAPWLWPRRALAAALLAGAIAGLALPFLGGVGPFLLGVDGTPRWFLLGQVVAWTVAGAGVVALAVAEAWRRPDRDSILLGLWVLGVFFFAAFVNWSINVRTLLPMAPAVGILVARRLEGDGARIPALAGWRGLLPLLPAGSLALLVAWADVGLAESARQGARLVAEHAARAEGALWVQGHWGFQHYAEAAGARSLDMFRSRLSPGDLLVVPVNNTNPLIPPAGAFVVRAIVDAPSPRFLATMDRRVGAGFHSDVFGPAPFVFGVTPPERYLVLEIRKPLGPGGAEAPGSSGPTTPAR